MHSSQKVFAQKPAGVAGWSMGSPEPEHSKPLAPQILSPFLYLESQPLCDAAWGTQSPALQLF